MPRRSRYIVPHSVLAAFCDGPGFEQFAFERDAAGTLHRRHTGWRWRCGCSAFYRVEEDGHLWVPCRAHTPPVKRAAALSGPAEEASA